MNNSNFTFLYVAHFPKYGYTCVNQSEYVNPRTDFLKELDLEEKVFWAYIPVPFDIADQFESRLQGYLGQYLISGFGWFLGCTKEEVKAAVENTIWYFNTVAKISTNIDFSKMNLIPELEMWYFPWEEEIRNWPFGVVPKYPELYNSYNLEVYTRKTGSDRGRPKSTQAEEFQTAIIEVTAT